MVGRRGKHRRPGAGRCRLARHSTSREGRPPTMPRAKRTARKTAEDVEAASPAPRSGRSGASLTLRINFGAYGQLGPGKVRLLELIDQHGSISVAGRAMAMSYLRAWKLVDAVNALFQEQVVTTQRGGSHGGGASLTPFGRQVVENYRRMESEATAVATPRLQALQKSLSRAIKA